MYWRIDGLQKVTKDGNHINRSYSHSDNLDKESNNMHISQ